MADSDRNAERYDTAVDEYLLRSYGAERRRALEGSSWDPAFSRAELAKFGVVRSRGSGELRRSRRGAVRHRHHLHAVRPAPRGRASAGERPPALLYAADSSAAAITTSVESGTPLALVDPGISEDWAADLGSVSLAADRLTGVVNAARFAAQAKLLVVIATPTTTSVSDPTPAGASSIPPTPVSPSNRCTVPILEPS